VLKETEDMLPACEARLASARLDLAEFIVSHIGIHADLPNPDSTS